MMLVADADPGATVTPMAISIATSALKIPKCITCSMFVRRFIKHQYAVMRTDCAGRPYEVVRWPNSTKATSTKGLRRISLPMRSCANGHASYAGIKLRVS